MNNNTERLAELEAKITEIADILEYIRKPFFKENLNKKEEKIILAIGLKNVTMNSLSEYFEENNSTMTGIIDRLEKKEVIQRGEALKDRRLVLVSLTKKWRREYNSFVRSQERRAKYAFEQITQERYDSLIEMLSETISCLN